MLSLGWRRLSRVDRCFLWWAGLIALGWSLNRLRECFTPGNAADVILDFARLVSWHVGIGGVLVTAAALALGARRGPRAAETAVRRGNLALGRVVLVLCIMLVTGEAFLRVVFHEGASFSNNSGPIVQLFMRHYYRLNHFGSRGPEASGPKEPGRFRILVQGDSVTFGQGIQDAKDTYLSVLLNALNQEAPGRFEMAVLAQPGREIDGHLEQLELHGQEIGPDVIIYQWYPNDMELDKRQRPKVRGRFWTRWFLDPWLEAHSYAWWFLDDRLTTLLPTAPTSYTTYMNASFAPGTPKWKRFVMVFHRWSAQATSLSPRVLMVLYPHPEGPMGRRYVFRDIHDRVMQLAAASGIQTIDVLQTMDDVTDWNQTRVSRFEDHPNVSMHQRMADALSAAIHTQWPELFELERTK